jgi:hypothetical protein
MKEINKYYNPQEIYFVSDWVDIGKGAINKSRDTV